MERCVFMLDGRVVESSKLVNIWVKNSILMIELYNNLFLPLDICRVANRDVCMLTLGRDSVAFCRENDPLILEIEDWFSVCDASLVLTIGTIKHKVSLTGGVSISFDYSNWSESEVREWLKGSGMNPPLGCCYSTGVYTEWGCSIRKTESFIFVRTPNGWNIPVTVGRWAMFSVKLRAVKRSRIEFDFVGIANGVVSTFENIVYDVDGIHFDGQTIGTSTIAKMLVLGGSCL